MSVEKSVEKDPSLRCSWWRRHGQHCTPAWHGLARFERGRYRVPLLATPYHNLRKKASYDTSSVCARRLDLPCLFPLHFFDPSHDYQVTDGSTFQNEMSANENIHLQ